MNESDSSKTARNMMEQLYPNRIDPDKTVTDNFYDLVGYKNPSKRNEPTLEQWLTDGPLLPEEPVDDGFQQDVDAYAREYINNSRAKDYTMADGLRAFSKAFYASEGFADNLGTILQTNGAQWALDIGRDGLAEALATDWQFGIEMPSMRGGTWGLYGDIVDPAEKFGPDWKSLSPVQMRERAAQYKAKQVEQYWQGTDALPMWSGGGELAGQIFDVSNLVPTGYVGLAARLGGLTAGKVAAGATVGATWNVADAALDMYVKENEIDPSRLIASAGLGAVIGGLLPVVGDVANAMWRKHRQSGVQTKPAQIEEIRSDSLEFEQQKLKTLENAQKSEDPTIRAKQEALIDQQKSKVEAVGKIDSVAVTNTMNAATRNGDATDNARIIDDAIRWVVSRSPEDMEYSKLTDKMNRTPIEDIQKVTKSDEFAELAESQQAMVEAYIAVRSGKTPVIKKFDMRMAKDTMHYHDVQKRTNEYMKILKQHGQEYKYDILRHITSTGLASGGAGGVALGLTGDPEFAMLTAISTGSIAFGAPIAGRMYGAVVGDVQARLDSPDPAVRMEAIQQVKDSSSRAFLTGTHDMTTNNWTTVPIRQWYARGGVGKTLARDLEITAENVKLGVNDKLIKYGQVMANHNIPTKETPIISRLLTHQYNAKSPGVEARHIEAAKEMRKLYNAEVRYAEKAGVLSKTEADKLIDTAKKEGYLNRVYFVDYLQTDTGAKAFAERLAGLHDGKGMTGAEVRQLIETLTGMTQKQSLDALTNIPAQGGRYKLGGRDVRNLMRKTSGVAQSSKFLERGRRLPTHLEEALDPFLVRDLKTAFIKYVESTTSRVEHAKTFGATNERASAYRKRISHEWGDESLGKLAEDDILGAQFDPASPYLKEYFDRGRTFKFSNNIVQHWQNAKLVASAPLNFTQHLVYLPAKMAKWGIGSPEITKKMAGAYKDSALEIAAEVKRRGADGKEFVSRYGTMIDTITYSATGDLVRQQPHGSKMGGMFGAVHSPDFWLRASAFHSAEKWNRRVAGHVGKAIVDDTIARKAVLERMSRPTKAQTDELAHLQRTMASLGLNPKTPIKEMSVRELDDAGFYAAEKLLRDPNLESSKLAAAQRVSNVTNFQADYLNKPRSWHGPFGMWFGKFRTFMLHANAFVRDNVVKPLAQGDARPLAAMLVTGGISGATVAEIKDLIRNDDYEYSNLEKVLNGWMAVGALGMGGEVGSQIISHPTKFLDFLLGPVYSDMFKYGQTVVSGTSEAINDGELEHMLTLAEDLGATLATDFGPVKYGVGVLSQVQGTENPLTTKGDFQRDERRRGAGFEPLTGL